MKILLDTQAFLWLALDAPELTKKAKKIFLDSKNEFYISLASIWEISIKTSIGKLGFEKSFEKIILQQLQENSIQQLVINFRHIIKVARLPFHHRDPFDRLLAAQAIEEKLTILSSDTVFDKYGIKRIW
jgi:PIN domain nuclease of toxin-antitoxin system